MNKITVEEIQSFKQAQSSGINMLNVPKVAHLSGLNPRKIVFIYFFLIGLFFLGVPKRLLKRLVKT